MFYIPKKTQNDTKNQNINKAVTSKMYARYDMTQSLSIYKINHNMFKLQVLNPFIKPLHDEILKTLENDTKNL